MATKYTYSSGKTPTVKVPLSSERKRALAEHKWFVEYKNTDTRNAIAQGLQLVDHGGDNIFYGGRELNGFQVSFDQVLMLVNSKHSENFKFVAYHKEPSSKNWREWRENHKAPATILAGHKKTKKLKRSVLR